MWNELTLKQQLVVNWAITQPMPIHERFLCIAQAIDPQRFKQVTLEPDEDIRRDEAARLCKELAEPFFTLEKDEETGKETYSVKLELTRCPWPELEWEHKTMKVHKRIMGRKVAQPMPAKRSLYACSDGFENMTVYELSHVWTYLDAFGKSNSPMHLACAIAVIYRPSRRETAEELASGWRGDRRRGFYGEESNVAGRAEMILTLHPDTLSLLYTWMVSCRQTILDEYEVLFQEGSSTAIDPEKPDFGWAGLLLQVADGVVDLEKVSNHKWRTVFTYLAKLEHDRREAEFKQNMAAQHG